MNPSTRADLLLLAVTVLAAVSWIMSREAVQLMPPLLFMASRFGLAAVLLVLAGWSQVRRLGMPAWQRALRSGLVFALAMNCWVMGIHLGSHVGEGAFLTSLGVVLVPVLGPLFGETPPRTTWLALPVAVAGLALLSLHQGFRLEAWQVFYVASALIFALFFHVNTRAANPRWQRQADGQQVLEPGVPPLALTAVVLAMVACASLLLSVFFERWQPVLQHPVWAMAGWVVASAVLGTALRFALQTKAQSLSQHTHGVVIMVLEPVWVALLAACWLQESMSAQQLAGCALILASLLINRGAALRDLLTGWRRPHTG